MASDPYKCLGAAHIPLRKAKRTDDDWFERVDALAKDVREMVEQARADERAKALAGVRAWADRAAPNGSPQRMSVFWCELDAILSAEGGGK